MPCGHQPWNIYDKINTSAILPESPLCLLFHTTSLMFMCHDVRSWSTWTPTRRLYPNLLSGNYGKVCNLVKVTRLCLVKSPNLTYPNLSFVISSIQSFYLLFNIWHFDSQLLFLSANILVQDVYYDYIVYNFDDARTPLLIFVGYQLSGLCLKISAHSLWVENRALVFPIGWQRCLSAQSITAKVIGICFNFNYTRSLALSLATWTLRLRDLFLIGLQLPRSREEKELQRKRPISNTLYSNIQSLDRLRNIIG